jgi:hypothetical protein
MRFSDYEDNVKKRIIIVHCGFDRIPSTYLASKVQPGHRGLGPKASSVLRAKAGRRVVQAVNLAAACTEVVLVAQRRPDLNRLNLKGRADALGTVNSMAS